MWNKVVEEVRTYHRWLGIIFYHSPQFSRVLRIASVGTNVVIVLFVQAVTYNITDPNDGSCEKLKVESECVAERSPVDSSKSRCYWDSMNESCHYEDVNDSLSAVASVAILCSLISAPLAFCVQLIVSKILSAPVKSDSSRVINHHNRNQSMLKRLSLMFQLNNRLVMKWCESE